jgi:hypothetical protein
VRTVVMNTNCEINSTIFTKTKEIQSVMDPLAYKTECATIQITANISLLAKGLLKLITMTLYNNFILGHLDFVSIGRK